MKYSFTRVLLTSPTHLLRLNTQAAESNLPFREPLYVLPLLSSSSCFLYVGTLLTPRPGTLLRKEINDTGR